MALIECEECGAKISNKARACIHCGYPIAVQEISGNEDDKIFLMYEVETANKGHLSYSDYWVISGKANGVNLQEGMLVDFYNIDMVHLGTQKVITLVDYCKRLNFSPYNVKQKKMYDQHKNKYVLCFAFDKSLETLKVAYIVEHDKVLTEQVYNKIRNEVEIIDVNGLPVMCPKCGSNQIQVVQQKWSIMTGFMTNKVNRVCMNCMHKF